MPAFSIELKHALGNGPMTVAEYTRGRNVQPHRRARQNSGKLVVELDLRGNMDAATIRQVLEANQTTGVQRVALAE